MTILKKFAWYGSSVAFATVLALALIATPVQAATTAAPVTAGAALTNNVIGTSVGNGVLATISNAVAVTGSTALVAGDTITVTFPTGYTVNPANVAAGDFTIIQAADGGTIGVATAPTAASATANSITLTVAGASLSTVTNAGRGVITITGAALTGNEIIVGTQSGTGTLTVATSKSDSGTATVTRIGVTASPGTASIPADGVSTSIITVAAAAAALANGDTITLVTTGGSFIANTAVGGALLAVSVTAGTPAAPLTTVSFTAPAGAVTTAAPNGSVTLRAPSTGAGSAQISVFATPVGGGAAQLIASTAVTFTATAAVPVLTSITVTPTATQNVAAVGGTGNAVAYTVTLLNQNGAALGGGTTVTVSTSGNAVVDSNGTTCNLGSNNTGAAVNSDADCTYVSTGAGDIVEIYGINVAGSTTVTFRATPVGSTTPVSVTRTVTLTGSVDTMVVTTQYDNNGGANFGTGEAAAGATANTATFTAGFRAVITAKDSGGNAIVGFSPDTVLITPSTCANTGASGVSTATVGATQILTVGSASAGTVCTITVTEVVGSVTKTATGTFTIGATLGTTSVLTVNAVDMGAVATQNVTVDVKDASGNPVGDGTSVTLVVSAGAVATASVQTVNGTATFIYVSPGTAQNVNLTAVAGSVNASKAISVGGATPPAPTTGEGTFASAPAASGVSIVVFNGGTVAQLAETAAGLDVVSVSATVDGAFVVYIVGAPAFVNAAFNAAFPDGLAAGTAVILKK